MAGCYETTRKIVLHLKMIEWKFFGLGDGTAGMFLANHYSEIGPYFGDKSGHNWPHSPLNEEPNQLELTLNEEMMKITDIISNGTLKNVSILDLPAFGSPLNHLEKSHGIESNWPIEANLEVLKSNDQNPLSELFLEYKMLLDDWEDFMMKIYRDDPKAEFTLRMQNNRFFNHTKHIQADLKTFLKVIHGSFLNPSKDTLPTWKETAKTLFATNEFDKSFSSNGVYDKLIMECAWRNNLLGKDEFDNEGGCESFLPTLTSKGFCHTFNGQTAMKTWKTSDIMNASQAVFPTEHVSEVFHGAGYAEGKI